MTEIDIAGGRYTAVVDDLNRVSFKRRGEFWPGAICYMEYKDLVVPLARRVALLEAALIHEYNEEWNVGDGITDAAKVQFLIDRTPK